MHIINAKIHTIVSDIIENGFIKISNGKIEDLGDMSDYNNDVREKDILDLNGLNVYPGFIDAHSHIGIFEDSLTFEGDDGNEVTDPITPQLRALDAINPMDKCFKEALKGGVTTVVSGPGSANPIAGQIVAMKTYGNRIDDMIIKSPVAIKFSLGENPKCSYNEKNQTPSTRMATAALIREQLYKAKQYEIQIDKSLNDSENFDYPDYDIKCESLVPLLEGKISAHFHVHRADDIFTAIRIAKEFNLDYKIVHATEGHLICNELKKEKVDVFSGPFICDRAKPELKNLSPKSPGIMSKSGINVSIITDHPEIPEQYLTLCAALAVKEGMDKFEALKSITINPAKACGIDDRVGSISIGKDADLIVYDESPLDFYPKIILTIVDGKQINL